MEVEERIAGWKAQTQYATEYQHGRSTWAFTLHAVDDADAARKIESIKKSLVLLGRLEGIIKVD